MSRLLPRCFALLLALALSGGAVGHADEPPAPAPAPAPRDDALDRLLEKLEKPAQTPDARPAGEPTRDDSAKPDAGNTPEGQPRAKPEDAKKPSGDVSAKDQALDSLLEKLGASPDKPAAEDEQRRGRPMPGEEGKDQAPAPGKPDQREAQDLTGKSKEVDEHLEELTGRHRKKKNQDAEQSGPLSKVIKEMREVEQRLGQPDTGEETRKKQTEIVKNLEQLIEQLRNASSQSRGQRIRTAMQPGQQPGQQQGQQPGANAQGAPSTKPAKPDGQRALVNGKDIWGHLPDALRDEMDNVAKEGVLPSREELIRLYYLSVSKKSLNREE